MWDKDEFAVKWEPMHSSSVRDTQSYKSKHCGL